MTGEQAKMVSTQSEAQSMIQIPKVSIKFCTQCKWNLRAAYYAQELLQTFSTTIGEISLLPSTGGIFTITLYHFSGRLSTSSHHNPPPTHSISTPADDSLPTTTGQNQDYKLRETLIWDRKRDSGFPETKELKNRIRNIIDPDRDMGHIDRSLKRKSISQDIETLSSPSSTKVNKFLTGTTGSHDLGQAIARGLVERENSGGSTGGGTGVAGGGGVGGGSLHSGNMLSLSREVSNASGSPSVGAADGRRGSHVLEEDGASSKKVECEDCK